MCTTSEIKMVNETDAETWALIDAMKWPAWFTSCDKVREFRQRQASKGKRHGLIQRKDGSWIS